MKNYIMGFLLCYTILITAYAAGLHTGKVVTVKATCAAPVDFVTQLEGK